VAFKGFVLGMQEIWWGKEISIKCTGVSYKMEDLWPLSVPGTQKVRKIFGVWRSTVVCHMPILFHLLATVLKIHN
jgi:hypothetical protein